VAKIRKVTKKKQTGKSRTKQTSRKSAAKSSAKAVKKSKARKSSSKVSAPKSAAKSPAAVRLTFSYEGDKVKLVSQQSVEMTVPPSDPIKGYAKQKGFWAELKSDQDRTLYRRVMHNPTRNDAEVFSGDPEQSISRAPAPKRKGVFVVVVPATENGREVTLSQSVVPATTGPGGSTKQMATRIRSLAAGPAKEIARVKLKK
jgi:hypothetical protein